jgi:hypothetical protein
MARTNGRMKKEDRIQLEVAMPTTVSLLCTV